MAEPDPKGDGSDAITGPQGRDPWLPHEVEQRVMEILDLPEDQRGAALHVLFDEHPDHATRIRERLAGAARMQDDIEAALAVGAGTSHPTALADAAEATGRADRVELPAGLERLGAYRILEVLGEGGMGTVYLAEQREPIRRRVALKVMREGMDHGRLLQRFDLERRTLGRLTHGSVARILDAGSTDGRLWFAMEHVDGAPITRFCDERRLSLEDRIRLFSRVCEAVHHAHQKGIIHRDLKPGNILVTEEGQHAVPKVIDFGLARITQSLEDDAQRLTEAGAILGTPEYMSPEQAEPDGPEVDVRTDVFALGVVLYELLTGCLPTDFSEARRKGMAAVQGLLRTADPQRPSSLWDLLEDRDTLAAVRRETASRYSRLLHGDLSWIVMRALARDPDERYQSAQALLDELRRYLADQPIEAGPPSTTYRLRKFVARNRVAVAASLAVVASLVVGLVLSLAFYVDAERARGAMQEQRNEAQRQATLYQTVNAVLNDDLLAGASPESGDRDLKVREALHYAARRLDQRSWEDPFVEAELRRTFGMTYDSLGDSEAALPLLERAETLLRAELGAEHARVLEAASLRAKTLRHLGRLDDCRSVLDVTLPIAERTLGARATLTLELRTTRAHVLLSSGQSEEAEDELEQILAVARDELAEGDESLLGFSSNLVQLYIDQRRLPEAEALQRDVLAKSQARDPDHPRTLIAMNNLAVIHDLSARYDESEDLHRRTLELRIEVLGEEHPTTVASKNNLANVLRRKKVPTEAAALFEAVLAYQELRDPKHPRMLAIRNNLASTYRRLGRIEDAERMFLGVKSGFEELGWTEHMNYFATLSNLARVYEQRGRFTEAEAALRESQLGHARKNGATNPRAISGLNGLGQFYRRQKRWAEAEAEFERALELGDSATVSASVLHAMRRGLAESLFQQGRHADAERILEQGHRIAVAAEDRANEQRYAPAFVALYDSWGRPEDASRWRRE